MAVAQQASQWRISRQTIPARIATHRPPHGHPPPLSMIPPTPLATPATTASALQRAEKYQRICAHQIRAKIATRCLEAGTYRSLITPELLAAASRVMMARDQRAMDRYRERTVPRHPAILLHPMHAKTATRQARLCQRHLITQV